MIAITKELTDTLRKNKTIDWQKRESALAKMRMMIKKLLKKYKYPPEGMEAAVQIVMTQCELWTDNHDMSDKVIPFSGYKKDCYKSQSKYEMVAEEPVLYGKEY